VEFHLFAISAVWDCLPPDITTDTSSLTTFTH